MTDVWSAKADALQAAIKAKLDINSDAVVLEFVSTSAAESIAATVGEEFKDLSRTELHLVIAALIAKLQPDDGIEFKGNESGQGVPVWLAATPAIDGYLPNADPTDRRWIRLDTITAVFAQRSVEVSDDPHDWLYSLTVQAEGKDYHASAVRFRGTAAYAAAEKVLHAVARLVTL